MTILHLSTITLLVLVVGSHIKMAASSDDRLQQSNVSGGVLSDNNRNSIILAQSEEPPPTPTPVVELPATTPTPPPSLCFCGHVAPNYSCTSSQEAFCLQVPANNSLDGLTCCPGGSTQAGGDLPPGDCRMVWGTVTASPCVVGSVSCPDLMVCDYGHCSTPTEQNQAVLNQWTVCKLFRTCRVVSTGGLVPTLACQEEATGTWTHALRCFTCL